MDCFSIGQFSEDIDSCLYGFGPGPDMARWSGHGSLNRCDHVKLWRRWWISSPRSIYLCEAGDVPFFASDLLDKCPFSHTHRYIYIYIDMYNWSKMTIILATSENYISIDPKQHKFQTNHMSAPCHAHRFLWFQCMGLCSVMSIDLSFLFSPPCPPPDVSNQISFCSG